MRVKTDWSGHHGCFQQYYVKPVTLVEHQLGYQSYSQREFPVFSKICGEEISLLQPSNNISHTEH